MHHLFPPGSAVRMQGLWLAHYCNPSIEQPPTSIEGMDSDPQSGDRLLASWCFARGSVVSFLFSYSTAVGNWSPGLSLPPHHSVFSRPQIPNPFPVLNHLFQAVIRPCLKIFAFLSHGGGVGGQVGNKCYTERSIPFDFRKKNFLCHSSF